ncbi:hypothetical protein D9V37_10540 [Nocardioides mangrovicus]|uniref:Uncharacterized protein n=1 Tax=Nocardioides mangrovicus TaxID=2478913 RepID=A0A3L8P244_9ACTN|nr:hypothetical protein [Nocardioides mangrovicus]RLV49012.1 hypothetical protein D9V37_10540 [Nocardioides mangrovicus]
MPSSISTAPHHPRERRRRRGLAALLGFVVAVAFPLLITAPANADGAPDPDPVGHLLGDVTGAVQAATAPVTQAASPQHQGQSGETSHAGSSSAHVETHHAPLAQVSGNDVGSDSSGRPHAHATTVGVGGTTVIGSSDGGHSQVPDNQLCASTSGALCVRALYGDSSTQSASAATSTGLLAACVGGDDATGATCSGQQLGLAQGSAQYDETGSQSSANVAGACLRAGSDGCDVGLDALSSSSGSGATQPDITTVTLGGTTIALPRDTSHLDAPSGCTPPDALCSTLNRTDTSSDGDSRDAVATQVLTDLLGVGAGSSSSDTAQQPAGETTTDPVDGATAQLVDLGLGQPAGDLPLLGVSQNSSTDDGEQASADGTLLSVAGQPVISSQSTLPGGTTGTSAPDNPLCEMTGGSLCAQLLYADSDADHGVDGADANSQTGLAATCLGGDDPSGASCDGVAVGVAQGESHLHRGADGTQSSSSTSAAGVCVVGTTGCTLSGDVLASHGSASSTGAHDSGGSIADVGVGGTSAGAPSDPLTLSVPDGCTDGTVVCTLLDQGTAGAGTTSGAGTSQTVAQVGLLGGVVGLTGAHTTAGATATRQNVDEPPTTSPQAPTTPGTVLVSAPGSAGAGSTAGSQGPDASSSLDAFGAHAAMPNTGGPWSGSLALAALLLAAGVTILARWRRVG